jgi:hypothetical protein
MSDETPEALREIDKQIAKALGYTVEAIEHGGGTRYAPVNPDGARVHDAVTTELGWCQCETEEAAWSLVPHFTTDSNAADLVIEWLRGYKCFLDLDMKEYTNAYHYKTLGWGYRCAIYGGWRNWENKNYVSMRLALCRAALLFAESDYRKNWDDVREGK